ncbi:MAG TPA: hypothetical protein VK633_08280 [Verrucomicrobiae bacterium]|nr:hypothetical protein [Verrucomicrobiae bacterium]
MRTVIPALVLLAASRQIGVAADVRFIEVNKSVAYVQNGSGSPLLQTVLPYRFGVEVELTRTQGLSSAALKWPHPVNVVRNLTNYLTFWEFSQDFPSSESLNLAHPNGTYALTVQGAADGKKTNTVTLSADVFPNPVHIANFVAAQTIDGKKDFTVQWDPPGTASGDKIEMRVFENGQLVFETGSVPGMLGTLAGTATSAVIPKNTLRDGGTFRAVVVATRKSTADSLGYPGVTAWASYSRQTAFTMRTIFPTLDVNWYGLAKMRRFVQTSALAPLPLNSKSYSFGAFAVATDPLNLKSASVKVPNGATKTLAGAGASWTYAEAFDTAPQLDAAYLAGAYELTLQTVHNGAQKLVIPTAAAAYPTAPVINNWNEIGAIDSAKPFVLQWAPLAGGTGDDFVQVTIRKSGQAVFRTAESPLAPGALDGRASSVILPAGLLLPGEVAEATLSYLKANALDPFSYPKALGVWGCACETMAAIRARGGNVAPPALSGLQFSNSVLGFTVSAVAGRQYTVQTSTDFRNWTDLFHTNSPGSAFLFKLQHNPAQRVLGLRAVAQ